MDFSQLVKQRRSVRHYEIRAVEGSLLRQLVEAARWAPSALNMQPWEFILVTDPEIKRQLGDTAAILGIKWPHVKAAPAVIVICARKTSTYARDDCLLAAQNIMLQATDLGLGTCYVGGFSQDAVRALLSIPEGYIVPGLITVGYPANVPPAPDKRPLTEIAHTDTFDGRGVGLSAYRRAWQAFWKILRGKVIRRPARAGAEAQEESLSPGALLGGALPSDAAAEEPLPPGALLEAPGNIWQHPDEEHDDDTTA